MKVADDGELKELLLAIVAVGSPRQVDTCEERNNSENDNRCRV